MTEESLPARVLNIVAKSQPPLLLGLLGVILVGFGFLAPHFSQSPKKEIAINTSSSNQPSAKQIMVDVAGGVKNPGLYNVSENSRVSDALAAAGGLSSQADQTWVSKNINLAAKVTDGQKVYVNTLADVSSSSSTQTLGAQTTSSIININKATESELDTLPGVGKVTADKIIAGRPYQKVEELLSRKIVGQATYTKIKDQVSVY